MRRVVLLGPQRFEPTLAATLDSLGCGEPLAVVSAGWQEREEETEELGAHVGRELVNLGIYRAAEEVVSEDAELAGALRQRQDEMQRLQQLYRGRLALGLEAARDLLEYPGSSRFVEAHRRAAIRAVRTLDRQHLVQIKRIHEEFDERWKPHERDSVRKHRDHIAESLGACAAVAVSGGHVAVLINRLRLFAFDAFELELPIVAWSAGAMAVSERIVLFHDSPPQGPGDPEVLDWGLGLCGGVVALPHASRRLRLDDPSRVSLLSRRFAPSRCVPLDTGVRLDWDGESWTPVAGTRVLGRRGAVRKMVAS
jgi:hypothetical protein